MIYLLKFIWALPYKMVVRKKKINKNKNKNKKEVKRK